MDMVAHFKPTGRVLEPFRGRGVLTDFIPGALWCERDDGKDFFQWHESVDWIITNPPYSIVRECWTHAAEVADNIVFLMPVRTFFGSDGFIREVDRFGAIHGIRHYGTGGKLGFPMGNLISAIHCQRGYRGSTRISRYSQASGSGGS